MFHLVIAICRLSAENLRPGRCGLLPPHDPMEEFDEHLQFRYPSPSAYQRQDPLSSEKLPLEGCTQTGDRLR